MKEARLYTKIENNDDGMSIFHYHSGDINASDNDLKQYTKLIKELDIKKYINDFSDIKEILYHMNVIEYKRLINHYRELKESYDEDCSKLFSDQDVLKNEMLLDIKLKREFESWFKINGYKIPFETF